jgi:gamma-glutamyltranspeptidase
MRVLWFRETIKQAIDAARLHHQLLPPYVSAEPEFPKVILLSVYRLIEPSQS